MAIPNLLDTWKITYKYHMGITRFQNVIHVQAPHSTASQTIANEAGSAWFTTNSCGTKQVNACVHDTINVQKYDGASAPLEATVGSYTGVAGGQAGGGVPAQVCAIGTLRTALGGRSFRGRIYVGALGSSAHVQRPGFD
jgi:hypothetical protein